MATQRPEFNNIIISAPVLEAMAKGDEPIPLIISFNVSMDEPQSGVRPAKYKVLNALKEFNPAESQFYVFAKLPGAKIKEIADQFKDQIAHIWRDEKTQAHLLQSTATIKANACWNSFAALGEGITWAVMDTGIYADHPHFAQYKNIDRQLSRDFCDSAGTNPNAPLVDLNGHGTHVAGIIAGQFKSQANETPSAWVTTQGSGLTKVALNGCPSGVAPKTRLVSIKVLNDDGTGEASSAISALEYLRSINDATQEIKIDGVNISLGYPFDPKWYGCGHSPLCEEVDRAARSGITVVISCGNSGYGKATLDNGTVVPVAIGLSIADPANAHGGIAVGSVHKNSPVPRQN